MTSIIYKLYLNQYLKLSKFPSRWKLEFVGSCQLGKESGHEKTPDREPSDWRLLITVGTSHLRLGCKQVPPQPRPTTPLPPQHCS